MAVKTITYNGETLRISQWAKRYNLTVHTISMRLRRGWNAERIFSEVLNKVYLVNGENLTGMQISKKFGMNPNTLYVRIWKGWSIDRAINPPLTTHDIDRGINEFNFAMRKFYTKQQRLESYKRVIAEIKELRMKVAA